MSPVDLPRIPEPRTLLGRLRNRFDELHERYGRLFWTLHSVWALLTGVAVLVLAHNRYGYVPWVVLFLGLTWASTLFFSRVASALSSRAWRFAQGFFSYLTRVMYQETLFFLIPFYFYSTTFPSWNSLYVVTLGILAAFSCYDLVFDRLLRTSKAFSLAFFSVVTFSALQFLFPLLFGVKVYLSSYMAAVISVFAAVPLAFSWHDLKTRRGAAALVLVLVAALGFVRLLRPAVPPVPLRLIKIRFAARFDPQSMATPREYEDQIPLRELRGRRLWAIATIFAPTELHTSLNLRFLRDGEQLRASRTVDLVAHPRGFRLYDALPDAKHGFEAGKYTVEVWTAEGHLVGRASLEVTDDNRP